MLSNQQITDLENQLDAPKEFFIKKELLTVDELNCIVSHKVCRNIFYSRWLVKNPRGNGNVMVLAISKLFSEMNRRGRPKTISKLIGLGEIKDTYYDFGDIKIQLD